LASQTNELEKEWEQLNNQKFSLLLERSVSERRAALEHALKAVNDTLPKEAQQVLIGVHATHMVEAMLSSPLPIRDLQGLEVDFCLTIHDDLYAVSKRLEDAGFPLNYQQLLLWRSAELLVADLAASQIVRKRNNLIDPPNFWLGAKHPKSSVHRLLSEPSCPKVYAAFSISGLLEIPDRAVATQLISETNQYRKGLYQRGLVVFDPATLDDRLLINKVMSDTAPRDEFITIHREDRWPYRISDDEADQPAVDDPPDVFPRSIAHAEAFLLKGPPAYPHQPYTDVDAHITQIDLRYVQQADFITVWRPFSQGVPSVGCYREATTARDLGKEVIAYCPGEDTEKYRRNPGNKTRPLREVWSRGVPLIPDVERFWQGVDKTVERIRSRRSKFHSAAES